MKVYQYQQNIPNRGRPEGVPGAKVRRIKLRGRDGVSVELLQYLSHPQPMPAPRRACDVGCNHIALQVDALDEMYQMLRGRGVMFHCPPRTSPDRYAKVAYCRDPEGVIVELVELLKIEAHHGD